MIILSLLTGSRLYGLANEKSDFDIINIFVKHRRNYYLNHLDTVKRVLMRKERYTLDIQYIDLIVFTRQLLKCNPNFVLPMSLPNSILWGDENGRRFFYNFDLFHDYKRIKSSFEGMSYSLGASGLTETARFITERKEMLLKSMSEDTEADLHFIRLLIDDILLSTLNMGKGEGNGTKK